MPSLYFILNVFCCADLGVARSGGSARPTNFSRPGGGVDSQEQGYDGWDASKNAPDGEVVMTKYGYE